MAGDAEDSLVRNNNRQWTAASRVEAEGLEWLYADPSAIKNNANQLEEYLLGKSIEGARGELGREIGDPAAAGSLLNDAAQDRTLDSMLSKFREDPLFIIKKAELHQRQVLQKYETLARSGRDIAIPESSAPSESVTARKVKSTRGISSTDGRQERRRDRSRDRHRDYHRRSHRDRSSRRERKRDSHNDRSRRSVSAESFSSAEGSRNQRDRRDALSHRRGRHSHSDSPDASDHKRTSRGKVRDKHRESRRSGRRSSSGSSRGSEDSYVRRRTKRRRDRHRSRRRRSYSYSDSDSNDSRGMSDESGARGIHHRRSSLRHRSLEDRSSSVSHESAHRAARRRRSSTNSSECVRSVSPRRQRNVEDSHISDHEVDVKTGDTKPNGNVLDKSSAGQTVEPIKRKHGPERPRKDTLKYAFAVTDDIMPPQAIQDRAEQKRRELEEQKRLQRDLYASKDNESRVEAMLSHGSEHLKERMQQMEQHDRRMQSQEEEVQKDSGAYISTVKQRAYETANLAERIRQRAPKSLAEDE